MWAALGKALSPDTGRGPEPAEQRLSAGGCLAAEAQGSLPCCLGQEKPGDRSPGGPERDRPQQTPHALGAFLPSSREGTVRSVWCRVPSGSGEWAGRPPGDASG